MTPLNLKPLLLTSAGAALLLLAATAHAQNGLSDDRVSLPDGPGSIGGIGENVAINPNMGSASFTVKLSLPAGANAAMTPTLSLDYASGAGMGVAGIGWDLATSSIERTVQKGLPTYTLADRFAADGGSELVYVGDLDGSRVYRARFEGAFIRYRWYGAGTGEAGYWTAEYPDGRVGTYGASPSGVAIPSARVQAPGGETFRYYLVELRDTVGRRIVQTYRKEDGWPLLDEVQYAFGGQASPRFSVRMAYEARGDVESNATPGFEIKRSKRLQTVQVMSDATAIRRYELVYESEAKSGGMSRLARVEQFGRDGGKLPIAQSFSYSRTLTGTCDVGCEAPFMVDMGTLTGGVDIATGHASLIDINGDSLPDVLDTDVNGVHHFHISELSTEGRPGFTGAVVTSAATTGGSSFILSSPGVQLLDVNGDGFTDIVDQVNGIALCNTGAGDWSGSDCIESPGDLPTLSDDTSDPASESDPLGMRFFDYDNDKRVDLLRTPDAGTAVVSRNTGTGYVAVSVDAIGAAFDAENLQLDDINGDGLQDPVMLVSSGASATLQFKLNLGFGRWSPTWSTVTIAGLGDSEVDGAVLQDLDGDGLSDIVVVSGATVSYWRNRNAARFDAREDIVSAQVDGDIPERTSAETVVFADMNGNGTDDVVWISSGGHVRFLELFPVRPNLLSRVDNGIGFVRVLEYGTSIAQRARDAGTANAWQTPLPQSMNVVTATDDWVTLTGGDGGAGVHQRRELDYHDGFYDGVEKSFRGFELVEQRHVTDADDAQEPFLERFVYDVGRDDPYHNGLNILTATFGGASFDVPLREIRVEYGDCPVAGVTAADPPVRYVCQLATTTTRQEGAPTASWQTVRTELDHDGYGNVIEQREGGVVSTGPRAAPAGCGACRSGLPPGLAGGPCGPTCLGDERVTRSTFVVPGAATGGAWLPRLPVTVTVSATADGRASETTTYYDGDDFVGLPAGQATRGLVTRRSQRISSAASIDTTRNAWDANGNLASTLDPNGAPTDATAHRRDYEHDARGLRVTRVTVHAGTYDLVQDVTYEASFLKASEATAYRVRKGGADVTPRNPTSTTYDEFGRVSAIVRPGDSREAPTMSFDYELGDPVSRVVSTARRTPGGPPDLVSVACQDGRGRTVQSMNRLGDGLWRVDGFRVFNSASEPVRAYIPYGGTTGECALTAPTDVPFIGYRRDALGRVVEETAADGAIYGEASVTRTAYGPLSVTTYDKVDTDATSALTERRGARGRRDLPPPRRGPGQRRARLRRARQPDAPAPHPRRLPLLHHLRLRR